MTPKKAQLAKELDMLCMYWNTVYGTKFRSFANALNNYVKIRAVYSKEEILQAIKNIQDHPFWFDKMPHRPIIFFRLKNTVGEPVDYIADLLLVKEKPKLDFMKQELERLGALVIQ